ncbi:MAG: hypothetical protein ACE366_13130 [Bradymonadia bacterium]
MYLTSLCLIGLLARPPLIAAPDEAGWRQHVAQLEEQALRAPDSPAAPMRLAAGFARRRRVAEALEWASEAARRGAHPLRLALIRGDAFFFANRFEEAAAEYFEVASTSKTNTHAHAQLWQCLRAVPQSQLGRTIDVLTARELLLEAGLFVPDEFTWPVQPDMARAAITEGHKALGMQRPREAVAHFQKAIKADGTHPEAFKGMAMALSQLGEKRQALGAWQLFLGLNPDDNREIRQIRRRLIDEERRRGLKANQKKRKRR